MVERRRDENPLAAEGDLTEQERAVVGDADEPADPAVPDGVDPADAHEQQQAVEYDEDDYR
ncbi:hypothetical protein [Jiangella gansuensis]|uniref:hypothetical protein n=1 Tax=Jiangella gansuensis TaxID=281473 RepID=UPI00047AA9DD|nr:hypothetical protein [Jiangella gansuensis]